MDKTILKKFAVESRIDLMEKIKRKISLLYVEEDFNKENKGDIIVLSNEKKSLTLTKEEYDNREKLVKRIHELGMQTVIEEAAYTWFNRIIAIRYMELHDFLPLSKNNSSLGIKVLSSTNNDLIPEILKFSNLINPDLDISFNKEVYSKKNNDDQKFKYIILLICKKLASIIPQVFGGVTDYIDLLIPDNMIFENGFIYRLIHDIPVSNFENVEIIGWLYQYYISDKKDEVFSDLKKNIKITKENIPSATQIFTPDWVVMYMIENTLGKYAIKETRTRLKYYIDSDEKILTDDIKKIKFLDPCCGSGHILVYAFEMFLNIYLSYGYNKKEIPEMILKNNLYGLDIDDRAGQLATLSVLLKAREIDKDIFNKEVVKHIHIMSIQESNQIDANCIDYLSNELAKEQAHIILEKFYNAKEYGSLIKVNEKSEELQYDILNNDNIFGLELKKFLPLLTCADILSESYDIVVTNPPYMGAKGMSDKLATFVKKNYNDSKSDMFAVFIERCRELVKKGGYYAMITQPSILFLSSFEKLREKIITEQRISSLLYMGRGIFGVDFGSAAFVLKNEEANNSTGDYFRLHQRTFQYIDLNDIRDIFLSSKDNIDYEYDFSKYKSTFNEIIEENEDEATENIGKIKIHYKVEQNNFKLIPGMPFSFWLGEKIYNTFKRDTLKKYGDAKFGMSSGDGEKYIKNWYEVDYNSISFDIKSEEEYIKKGKKWNILDKGGPYRKWYGNKLNIVFWENNGFEIRNNKKAAVRSPHLFFKPHISWPLISSVGFNARLFENGYILDTASNCLYYNNDDEKYYLLGLLNSNITNELIKMLNPTMNFSCGVIEKIPVIYEKNSKINELVKTNIEISKTDWDSFEISWDFKRHPLILNSTSCNSDNIFTGSYKISDVFEQWEELSKNRYLELMDNEQTLNRLFNKIYNLETEFDYHITDKQNTIRTADKAREIKSLISYSIGCMFGRYSLDEFGLVYAGGKFDKNKYLTFKVDEDNIIPISEEENVYYNDDIVGKFKKFIEVVFGKDTLNDNLDFIAETLGKKDTENSVDTIRRYFVNDFFKDHLQIYQKKPIYWQFESGKNNGFKCLIYMHRYDEQIISKIRVDYLHKTESAYKRILEDINYKLDNLDLSVIDRKNINNKKIAISNKLLECTEYDEKVGHLANKMISINLDDGIKVNYDYFKDILTKIK